MKKTMINIGLILTAILVYILQVNFFNWFNIAGVMPNLFVIFILFIGLFVGYIEMASGMLIHELSILIVILNSMRLMKRISQN